ncbi:MAG: hypothetical protein KME13_03785 [Myxacorys californica WJT36-NPBG1]|jgi:hypothetical protein|nr:hypothetical protein [Myxacorys californica WJT36-NPBG1]
MFKMARLLTFGGLSLAISSFLGLMARNLPPLSIGLWTVFLLLAALVFVAYFAGPLLDRYFGWEEDTTLGIAIGIAGTYILGGAVGWLIS